MPLYEYRCEECGKEFQIFATIAEYTGGINVSCPKCKSSKVARIIGRPTVLGTTRKGSDADSFDDLDSGDDFGDDDESGGGDFDDEP